jgi:hypothetical protein
MLESAWIALEYQKPSDPIAKLANSERPHKNFRLKSFWV